ncbi:MAG: hypothetical protein A2283_18630 [Lentisphaerae bacterium RIFOXYA12_FULL_48_11]|nr:MAG: hypothetical protein A2283_18630 [Lentisphaerae bacterium RIFOXYA12_FULL_48_11]
MRAVSTIFIAVIASGIVIGTAVSTIAVSMTNDIGIVDFRYSPPWWQTAICLPDDPDKALVGKEGQLLYDYGRGSEKTRRFGLCIQPNMGGGLTWREQKTVSARVPIVLTRKEAAGVEVVEEAFVVASSNAVSSSAQLPTERQSVILVTMKNTGTTESTLQPTLQIQGIDPVTFTVANNIISAGRTWITASKPVISVSTGTDRVFTATLAPEPLKPGTSSQIAFFINRNRVPDSQTYNIESAARARDKTMQWWENTKLPYASIQIPDIEIQAMLESCIRNIWQAREIKNGKPAFHVGPTCYRGLWIVDGAFILESAALVGRPMDARAGIEYMLGHQKPDGSFEIIDRYWKENGIVLWAVTRHAFLTGDKTWLKSVWPKLEQIVEAISHLQQRSRTEPPDLDDGLMPAGFTDGGISGNNPEYSNVYWTLTGLKAVISAAEWLNREEQVVKWTKQYEDFMLTFQKAATRDMATDPFNNRYLPTIMGNAGKEQLPQRGQWAFLHAVYPGQIFPQDDTLVCGNLAMLRATKKQGLLFGTGWDAEGIWTYAASFYGHALLWQGNGQEAAQVLYDYANHACPTRVWREEQRPIGKGGHEVGDMPHNWASAEFIRLAVHLIEIDRGNELHLLEGFPPLWFGAGKVTRLNNVATPFGPLCLVLQVDQDGKTASLKVNPLNRNCKAVIVHLPDGTCKRLSSNQDGTLTFPVNFTGLSK